MSSSEMATKASWDYNTDIVIAGAGAAGLAASIEAVDNGASVILIDENMDVGGRAILSGGFVNVGGGSSLQKKLGIQDSPDLVFSDLTDPNKVGYRYNDRELVRAFADNVSSLCDWLMENGVVLSKDFMALEPLWYQMGDGESVARRTSCLWNEKSTTRSPAPLAMRRTPSGETSSGAGLTRPLEESARKKGVQILLRHKLRSIIKDTNSGKIVGI
nr:FAD-dependent oxidoreductase [Nitrososphaerota archaeon]